MQYVSSNIRLVDLNFVRFFLLVNGVLALAATAAGDGVIVVAGVVVAGVVEADVVVNAIVGGDARGRDDSVSGSNETLADVRERNAAAAPRETFQR